jgi:hypothetical protein
MSDLSPIAGMLTELTAEIRANHNEVKGQLKIIDRRLALIEQRLSNIEPFIPVDNKHLQFENA